MVELPAYFDEVDGGFEPTAFAASQWSSAQLVGPALCGLMARELEREHATDGFVPVRLTVDMFSAARFEHTTTPMVRVRDGKRIRVADVMVMQGGTMAARASAVLLRPSEQPPGELWQREFEPRPPALDIAPPSPLPQIPLFNSDGNPGQWSSVPTEHENATRKRTWQNPIRVITGEELSPFTRTAVVGEAASMMTNWGDAGIGFINTDMTLALSRMPQGYEIGVEADSHFSERGMAVGVATLFDRLGPFGSAMVTSVSNAARQISSAQLDAVMIARS
ncbi:thioesterase family protein [Nocardia sp. SYP-A9097]|uniref:acyl-CoA thioesterase domain-containing protein n=1 Tax=Nocardia sp. SYP-A9097 TaxID=2663237 RepID=UPI001324F153|nr:acyl-CoA thioesterase domain-containing protein [Nocardia sp. SYP-A9097]MRH92760.1 thioesterase family protein [Nocardia sp. SYP-A9097]